MIEKFLTVGLMALGILTISESGLLAGQIQSEEPPLFRDMAQVGYLEPVARVNPERPIRITLINQSGQAVSYIMTTYTGFRQLAAGSTGQLSGFELPAYLNINPVSDRTAVRYQVSVMDNGVVVRILGANRGGHRSMTIDQTGGVYIY